MSVAPLLPDGYQSSAWPDWGPTSRQLFLEEFLVVNADLVLTGSVDYESAREPLLLHEASGEYVSLAGERVDLGAGLTVNITEGTPFYPVPWLLVAALVGVVWFIK